MGATNSNIINSLPYNIISQKISQFNATSSINNTDILGFSQLNGLTYSTMAINFANLKSAIGGSSPGGPSGSMQYNSNGILGGASFSTDGISLYFQTNGLIFGSNSGAGYIDMNGYSIYDSSQLLSIQFDQSTGQSGVNFGRRLHDNNGDQALNWDSRLCYTISSGSLGKVQPAIDWANGFLNNVTNFSSILSVDWFNGTLWSGVVLSVDYGNRITIDASNGTSMDYNNRILYDATSKGSANWDSRTLTIQPGLGPQTTLDWINCLTYDIGQGPSLDWKHRILYDSNGLSASNYDTRGLISPNSTTVATWNNTGLSASNYGTKGLTGASGTYSTPSPNARVVTVTNGIITSIV